MRKIFSLKKIKPTYIPAVCWFLISTILLVLPGSSFPKDDWLGRIWFDKWVHIGMFALMVILWCWGLLSSTVENSARRKGFILTGIGVLFYGVGMELVQKFFIINRSFDAGDIFADAAGCVAGTLFSLGRYIKK